MGVGAGHGLPFFGLECKVYMVKISYEQKPYRRVMMETWGAQVVASPSQTHRPGARSWPQDPDSPGSLGIAISEAVEDAATARVTPNTRWVVCSIMSYAPDRHRPGSQEAAGAGGGRGGHRHRLRRGWLQLRRALLPLCMPTSCTGSNRTCASSRSSPRPARL